MQEAVSVRVLCCYVWNMVHSESKAARQDSVCISLATDMTSMLAMPALPQHRHMQTWGSEDPPEPCTTNLRQRVALAATTLQLCWVDDLAQEMSVRHENTDNYFTLPKVPV